jgi:hypothetical protein
MIAYIEEQGYIFLSIKSSACNTGFVCFINCVYSTRFKETPVIVVPGTE